jgi:multidrug efflux pump subunit AcrA (membrane-fusion protein)
MPDRLTSVDFARAPAAAARLPRVVVIGFERAEVEGLRERLRGLGVECDLVAAAPADGHEAARRLLERGGAAVVCLGERCAGEEARRLIAELAEAAERHGTPLPLQVVLAAGPDPALFQELISEDRIFYLSQRPPAAGELAALLGSAVRQSRAAREAGREAAPSPAARIEISDLLRRLAVLPGPIERAELLAEAAREIARAERAYCLTYDPRDQTLWGPDPASGGERRESAAVGLASFALRSGMTVQVARAGRDPRYDREADDPLGDGTERLVAVPVPAEDGRITAVLVAVRRPADGELGAADLEALHRLAAAAAPYLPLPETADLGTGGVAADPLFRREAVEHYQFGEQAQDPLEISPAWTRWSYWTLLGALAAALVFSLVGEIRDYATGSGVVWMGGRDEVTAAEAGTVAGVEVAAGQRVEPGQVLVRLYDAQEAAELARMEEEFELQLINRLRDPGDASAEQALIALRTQRQLARSRLGQRAVKAPSAGTASDVRVRAGQYLTPGQPILSIVHREDQPTLVVMLPGEYRPQLRRGMPIRFEIAGYRYAYQRLAVDAVSDEVVGPNEARRYLGQEIADALPVSGAVVIVRARLPAATFKAEGRSYRFHNGMHGTAEVEVRSEKILLALVPGLRALFGRGDA